MKIGIAAALSFALFSTGALAATDSAPRTFAVMSLIGDSMTIVNAVPSTGAHLDTNRSQDFDDPSGVLDISTLKAAAQAIKKVVPDAKPILLATDSAILRKKQGQLIADHHLVDADGLVDDLKKSGVTDFLLITKHRATTNLHTDIDTIGSGTLYGLGFYIDSYTRTQSGDSLEVGIGYLAPYAYFKIFLIDVATLAVEKEVDVTDGYILSNARNDSGTERSPWNILDNTQKFKALAEMIQNSLMENVPGMLAKAPPVAEASNP